MQIAHYMPEAFNGTSREELRRWKYTFIEAELDEGLQE